MFKFNKQVPIEDLIRRQINLWDTSHRKLKSKQADLHPNLTISRQTGSNGSLIAQKISDRLNWKIYDREIVDYIADNTQVHKNMVTLFDETTRREMDNLIASLMDSHAMSNEMYLKHLAKIVVTLGRLGYAIIVGRGGNFILPDNMAFKVRIIEDIDARLNNLIHFDKSQSWTLKNLKKDDQERKGYIQKYFGKNVDDPLQYDLIINLSKTNIPTAEDVIFNGLAAKFKLPLNKLHDAE